ncbi:MAG: tetratricopeptide repeat protein [Nitrospira sp.]
MTGAYTPSDLRRILHVTDAELRTCLRAASLPISTSKKRLQAYTFQQLVVLRTTKGLSDAGVSVRRIRKVLASLQRQLGDARSMASVKVYASGRGVIVWDGTNRWQPDSGQYVLNFEARPPATATRLAPRSRDRISQTESAVVWCARGEELQDHAPDAACRAYEEALRLDPSLAEAHVNVGRLYHEAGRLADAEASYRSAVSHRPSLAVAHFNLGVVLEDQGQDTPAITAYQQALQLDAGFHMAHCHLAELYERHGRAKDALRHYAAARRCRGKPRVD